ncbi:sigma-70 family RNA polymerase sigma factor [Solitalea sp. MAHUQ-68]|uniref:Sigma-70 family RNA polymerase sigma factor n=1 Tax=Solitalea agri TaxID=2953739 RepID=A0A9X2F4C2_9SPHI|nr:sigma-70 family RNA polymerase sigma factor [Solitalea agri]MCO4293930.1 sigma-70 family RNA polymerase sigma factor [Solitalea agri]
MKKRLTLSEEELVTGLKQRQKLAIEALYNMYSAALNGIILRIVHSEEDTSDVLQEVFLKIWNNASNYDPKKGRLFTWMANIARNQALDRLRSKSFRNENKNQELDNSVNTIDSLKSISLSPEHIGIKDLLISLKPEQKVIVDMIYFQGYKQNEVAEALNIPLGTVKTRLRLAIMELRKYFN